jgi:hypothetical protein
VQKLSLSDFPERYERNGAERLCFSEQMALLERGIFSKETVRCPPLIARCSPCSNSGRAIRLLVPYSRRRASDYAHNSRWAAHVSLESLSRLELVTQDAQFEPFKGSESGTAIVILEVPVIGVNITFGGTGLGLRPRVCRMWDKGRTKGEGHNG